VDQVEIAVKDTGVGIAPENLQRIMEPLYTTKARGLGLGLAIARTILEKCKGGLHVESTPGKGSTFTMRLLAALSDGGKGL
jgi:signal transduction histidine kinase